VPVIWNLLPANNVLTVNLVSGDNYSHFLLYTTSLTRSPVPLKLCVLCCRNVIIIIIVMSSSILLILHLKSLFLCSHGSCIFGLLLAVCNEDPLLEFEVESQFEGRPIAQLASIIVSQVSFHYTIHSLSTCDSAVTVSITCSAYVRTIMYQIDRMCKSFERVAWNNSSIEYTV